MNSQLQTNAQRVEGDATMSLEDGSRIAVIGGGPAGAFFAFFVLQLAHRIGLKLELDIFEPKDFCVSGPTGCNMCGGVISESLVQTLAIEGINLPPEVVQRGLDAYHLHMREGSVLISTPLQEQRIAAVHRGAGPRGVKNMKWRSFDGYLLGLAQTQGARVIRQKLEELDWADGRPHVKVADGPPTAYDLMAVAVGVNSATLKRFEGLNIGYRAPGSAKTYIAEFLLGEEAVVRHFGNSMHVFLLDMPNLEFAALIPKGEFVTLCLLGKQIGEPLVKAFLDAPEVRACFPPDWTPPAGFCHCSPRINVCAAAHPFADRLVFIGDCGVARLYKDGIGAAYRTSKAAAATAVFDGVSAEDFRRHFWPACQAITRDNALGRLIFAFTAVQKKLSMARSGILRMVADEQRRPGSARRMSSVMWDMFTGSAPYREVFLRTLHPAFWGRLAWDTAASAVLGPPALGPSKSHS